MPPNDEALWYPPLGLLKIARYHFMRGDKVKFVSGCDKSVMPDLGLFFTPDMLWDRVYITTLFTYHFNKIVDTIRFYLEAVGGTRSKIFVGGIMSSLMQEDLFAETGIYPILGTLTSAKMLGFDDETNIDLLAPDYSILHDLPYAIHDTFYAYTTRGCTNRCAWCGVPKIEPSYIPYIDIKPTIQRMREECGDYSSLCLMDNNTLASPNLKDIVDDLLFLGYGKEIQKMGKPSKNRTIDFNQGLDASHITPCTMELIGELNIKPMRIAFDRIEESEDYIRAVRLARQYGFSDFSNYMLYNFRDTPRDLYDRLVVNINLNQDCETDSRGKAVGKIYSYPMRYAPITNSGNNRENRQRDLIDAPNFDDRDWLMSPAWTRRFIRNVEVMKGVAHGSISTTSSLAWRTIGKTFREFIENLYMPEELLRNRNRHEKKVYPYEPEREPGSGMIEQYRDFLQNIMGECGDRFMRFHNAVSPNTTEAIRREIERTNDKEMTEWLKLYLARR